MTDTTPTIFDTITPQMTTFVFKGRVNINDEDVVVLRDNRTNEVEYLGVVDTVEKDLVTSVRVLPFVGICDNELSVATLNSSTDNEISVQDWIVYEINTNFVNTADIYSAFPIQVRDRTTEAVYYKAVNETDNLLDVLNEIYLNTGLYIEFSPVFEGDKIVTIYCDIYNANEQDIKSIRYDNPQIVNKIDYKFSQYGNYSKCTIKTTVDNQVGYFELYLTEDNKVTTNPQDERRIKKVKNKNVEFKAEVNDDKQIAEGLALLAQKTLCGDAFAYSIEFNVLRNAIVDWKFRQRCNFMAEDRLYESYITCIQYLNDDEARVTLGAYRYTLTDKFKELMKDKKEIGDTFNGIPLSTGLGKTIYWFTQENGNLYLNYPDGVEPPKVNGEYQFSIDNQNNLWYTYDDEEQNEPDLEIEGDRQLVYKY